MSKDEKTWYLYATPIDADAYNKLNKWDKKLFEFTEQGQPIRVSELTGEIATVTLLRTGESLEYSINGNSLELNNPLAGPEGLHEVVKVEFK